MNDPKALDGLRHEEADLFSHIPAVKACLGRVFRNACCRVHTSTHARGAYAYLTTSSDMRVLVGGVLKKTRRYGCPTRSCSARVDFRYRVLRIFSPQAARKLNLKRRQRFEPAYVYCWRASVSNSSRLGTSKDNSPNFAYSPDLEPFSSCWFWVFQLGGGGRHYTNVLAAVVWTGSHAQPVETGRLCWQDIPICFGLQCF